MCVCLVCVSGVCCDCCVCSAPVQSGLAGDSRLCTRLYAALIQFLQMPLHDCSLQIKGCHGKERQEKQGGSIEKFLFLK